MIDMQSMRIDVTVSQMDDIQFGIVITDLNGQKHTTQFVMTQLSLYKIPFKEIWGMIGDKVMHYLPQAIYKYAADVTEKPKQEQPGSNWWTAHYNTPMVNPNFTTEVTVGTPANIFYDEFDKLLHQFKEYKEAEKHATAVPEVQKTTNKSNPIKKLFGSHSG